ncbi:hypothetical protein EDD85DRAFT_959120 [Armillaria nabsnona]|nr:hypothetical protein EDD85DRAFT_959120 [Armillaria nabsnona]
MEEVARMVIQAITTARVTRVATIAIVETCLRHAHPLEGYLQRHQHEFVRKNLGNVISIPDGVKGTQFNPKMINKYDGMASRKVFWEWLRSMVYGYRITQLGGQERDEERLFILDSLLDGKAKQWFQYRLDRYDKSTPMFLEMIIDIYNRFIHDSALQDARQAFKDAKWEDADELVEGWKDLIK